MSAVHDFFKEAAGNPALREKATKAQARAVAAVAEDHGFSFTAAEYIAAVTSLGDEELDAVTGGAGPGRYANQETSYLLGRLEAHKGLTAIASNLKRAGSEP